MTSMIQLLKEALEKKLTYTVEGETISLLLTRDATKILIEELNDVLNREDDNK